MIPRRCRLYRGRVEIAGLVAAKLRAPVPLAPLLPRPRVHDLLSASAAGSIVVLLIGPSGSGKTAALSQWARGAWITLDAQDNDPIQFWRYVGQALGLGGPHPQGSDAFVAALAEGIEPATVLVLDEFEHVVAPGILRQLDLLISACGDNLTLVISSRVRPGLRLDRLQLAGRLTTLTWEDLRFSDTESASLERVDLEGWPGSLSLSGSELTDFLVEHVWAGLEPEVRDFLLAAAVPARFDVALMDAIRGVPNSAEVIDRLRRDALFLISDDGYGRWYRLQRSFREALLHRLETTSPEQLTAVRRAAARWHATSGDKEEAIGLALSAGELALAVRLLDDQLEGLYQQGRLVSLEQWLGALPDSALADSGLGRRALNLWCELGRFGERDRWISLADSSRPVGADEVWRLCLPRERGDLTSALRQGRAVLSALAMSGPQSASQARISVARTLLLAGRYAESQTLAAEIDGLWRVEAPAPVRVAMNGLIGLAELLQGSDSAARAESVQQALGECQIRPTARMMPEARILLALHSDDPEGELAKLIDESGYGNDLTMGAFASLLLAKHLSGAAARERLAAADALLAACPNPLGLIEFRNQVAAQVGEPLPPMVVAGESLSERELRVLQYLRTELTLREIAEDLFLSVNTVKTHARNVYRKLDIPGRHDLARH